MNLQKYKQMTDEFRQSLIKELKWQHNAEPAQKDILIVVHGQYEHVKNCLESISSTTSNYRLLIWDNNSDEQTKQLLLSYNPTIFVRSESNLGFVLPNNYLALLASSPYLILLNSDTITSPGWDDALIGTLQANPDFGVVGYSGRCFTENGNSSTFNRGEKIDYVEGWCMCLRRDLYKQQLELFDPKIKFAYCEDSDLCLRIKMAGYKLYAIHLEYVKHTGNATIKCVRKEKTDFEELFNENQTYFKEKWKHYLNHVTRR